MWSRCAGVKAGLLFFLGLLVISVFPALSPALADEPASLDERVQRLEQQLETLEQQNERLRQEILLLHEQLDEEIEPVPAPPSVLPPVPPVKQIEVAPAFDVGYRNGFFIASGDGEFALRLGGRLTSRFTAFDSGYPLNDEFSIERARLESDATLLDYYSLRIQVEFADSPKLKDGYLDIHYIPEARLRIGQFKVPYSYEALQSHKYLDFADLSLPVFNLRAGRDIGAMLHGVLWDKYLSYQLALVNGAGENRGDNNSSKDIAGRIALLPFLHAENELLSPMLLGVSGMYGDQNLALGPADFKTIAGTPFIDFASDTFLRGSRKRFGTEFIWPIGPASIKSEWLWMQFEDMQKDAVEENIDFTGWYVSGTYLLTGEKKTLGRVIPLKSFNPYKGAWGAWEIAARYAVLESEKDLFEQGLAAGTDRAQAFTIGLNWYLNPFLRMILDFEHTEFDQNVLVNDEAVDNEDVIFAQWQLEF